MENQNRLQFFKLLVVNMLLNWHYIGDPVYKIITMKTVSEKKIFIVDDDPLWSANMKELLINLGYTSVLHFESGEDCISNLHLNPAVIFLDYKMKAMNGLEVLRKAKAYLPGIGIVFCTATRDLSLAVNAMKSGSFDFLIKQHTSEETIAAVLENICTEAADKIY